eukprot:CAMPEP_0194054500 /NCGR_PEP_ID=MMETSP0009_2-20130614/53593_1 /TAXON_ID=210454 /ORGANISM="Grammatophora oceanica, Strain CCMP 410" /LENGTH=36 /DNA_ID= /DNA_START= /DNA_END= /DNA_ORIENTATION=
MDCFTSVPDSGMGIEATKHPSVLLRFLFNMEHGDER